MKQIKYYTILLLAIMLAACSDDDKIASSDENLFPEMSNTDLDKQLIEIFKDYNTRVEYRYIKNLLPSDWYYITPVKEEFVLPMSELIRDVWIAPLIEGSNKEFVALTFPKMLVYVGSPALQSDGRTILGEAEGGTLVRFTQINSFDDTSVSWIGFAMNTAYHEYAHVIHQRYGFPDKYRELTPNNYTRSGWTVVSEREALQKGIVTPYGTSSPQEDFAELFAHCIIATEAALDYYFVDVQPWDGMTTQDSELLNKDNEGRRLLREKRDLLKRYMLDIGLNIDIVREQYQKEMNRRSEN